MFKDLFQAGNRRTAYLLIAGAVAAYGWIAIAGPQGLHALIEKRREIRELQEQNASMAVENQRRKDRIKRLEDSRSEQEMEIRKQLKLQRPGETTFILPDSPKGGPDAPRDGTPQQDLSQTPAPASQP